MNVMNTFSCNFPCSVCVSDLLDWGTGVSAHSAMINGGFKVSADAFYQEIRAFSDELIYL
jgi:hypothetical protein